MLIKFLVILAFTSIAGSSDLILADDTKQVLICTYEDECPEDTIVRTAVGYGINILVKNVDLDVESGDFLLIKSGTQIDDGLKGITFTDNIDNERKYISLTNEVLIHFHVNEMNNEDNMHAGFELTVQRFDRKNDRTVYKFPHLSSTFPSITVNMRMLEPFEESLYTFRETVAMLGQYYIDNVVDNDFNLTEPISEADVRVTQITPCPIHWPHRATCHRITFALPIDYEYSESYQLNEYHLHRMWENALNFFNEDTTPTVTIYTKHYDQFAPWIITISVFIAIFAITYLIIGYVCSRIVKVKRMKTKEREELEEQVQRSFNRDHKDNLILSPNMDPDPLQTVPPLFQNDVAFFDPDRQSLSTPRRMTSQQDNFDESILNKNNMPMFNPRRTSTSP